MPELIMLISLKQAASASGIEVMPFCSVPKVSGLKKLIVDVPAIGLKVALTITLSSGITKLPSVTVIVSPEEVSTSTVSTSYPAAGTTESSTVSPLS